MPATNIPFSACEESAIVVRDAFLAGEGSTAFSSERATGRDEQLTGHVFRRFDAMQQESAFSH